MMNDSYLPGTLMVAYALRQQAVTADLVCMVTSEISEFAREALNIVYDKVIEVDSIFVRFDGKRKVPPFAPFMMTRLNALQLGVGGELGCTYDKVITVDADVLPLANYQHLFSLNAPAGIINEHKDHFLGPGITGSHKVTEEISRTGKWYWHDVYESICPHGHLIPKQITDRVHIDKANMGVNGSIFVLIPDQAEFYDIQADLATQKTRRLINSSMTWPDMQYLTMRWSGRWTNIDLRFSGFKGYPSLELLFGTHFAGLKPWNFNNRSIRSYSNFPDFQLWFHTYQTMLEDYPKLRSIKRLATLSSNIDELLMTTEL